MKLRIIFLLVFLSQAATALNYSNLPEMNLTIGSPSYQKVWDYNVERSHDLDGPPQGISVSRNLGYSNAWVKILGLDNVINDSGTGLIYASNQGNALTKYEYDARCPPSDYCWTTCIGDRYEVSSSTGRLSITANGQSIGNSEISAYSLPQSDSTLILNAGLSIETKCRKYSLVVIMDAGELFCVEKYQGIETYTGYLEDNAEYSIFDVGPQADLTFSHIAQDVSETSKGELTIKTSKPYSNFNFSLGNGSIFFSSSAYDLGDYLPDYNLLMVNAYSLPRIEKYSIFSNISTNRNNETGEITTILDFTLSYAETADFLKTKNCKLELEDVFLKKYSFNDLCQKDWKQALINASTDKKIFSDKEKISLSVFLNDNGLPIPDKEILVHYASADYTENTDSRGIAEFTFSAKYPNNKIIVEFLGDQEYLGSSKTLMVGVTNSEAEALFVQILPGLLLLIISAYGLYRIIKHIRG